MQCLTIDLNYFKINIFIRQVDFGIKKSAACKGFYQKLVDTLVDYSNMGGISFCIASP